MVNFELSGFMFSLYQVTAHILWLYVFLICIQVRRYNQQLTSDHYITYVMCMFSEVGMDHILLNKGKFLNYFYVCIYILLIYSIVSLNFFFFFMNKLL